MGAKRPFRTGDRVRCIDALGYEKDKGKGVRLTHGNIYTVLGWDGDSLIHVLWDNGEEGENYATRFELVEETPHDRHKIASDGLSTDYYKLPTHASELRHLISHKGMSFARGNVFKACYRLGEKAGVDALYDINKIIFFAEEMKEMIERGEVV